MSCFRRSSCVCGSTIFKPMVIDADCACAVEISADVHNMHMSIVHMHA